MLFSVILPAEGLDSALKAEAIKAGPPFVETPQDYDKMLRVTGWKLLHRESLNDEYLESLGRMVDGLQANADTFRELMSPGEFSETLAHRRRQVSAVERGLLIRELYLAQAV